MSSMASSLDPLTVYLSKLSFSFEEGFLVSLVELPLQQLVRPFVSLVCRRSNLDHMMLLLELVRGFSMVWSQRMSHLLSLIVVPVKLKTSRSVS